MSEVLTPERILEAGKKWRHFLFENIPIEEVDIYVTPEYKQNLVEKGREEGIEKGREEGIEKGAVSAKRETFIQILEHKFGEISDVIPEMIQQVDEISQLNEWINRALSAESLGDIWVEVTDE